MSQILSVAEVVSLVGLPFKIILELERREAFPKSFISDGDRFWAAKQILEYIRSTQDK